jgi:hypothetical protein
VFLETEVHIHVGELVDGSTSRAIGRGWYRSMKRCLCRELSEDGLKLLRKNDREITQIL